MVKAFSCGRHVAELIANVPLSNPLISEKYSPDRFQETIELKPSSASSRIPIIAAITIFMASWITIKFLI